MPIRNHQEMLLDPHTYATVLLGLAVKLCGIELLTWDPETIIMEVHDSIGHELPQQNINKLLAAVALVTTNNFYQSLSDFIRICNILTCGTFDVNTFDPADAEEIAWGITEALLIWPPDAGNEEPFKQDIIHYIGHAISAEGLLKPPDILQLGLPGMTATWSQVQDTFADDPTMFGAIQEVEQTRSDAINQSIKSRLRELLEQLEKSKLLTTASATETMLKMLQQLRASNEAMKPVDDHAAQR